MFHVETSQRGWEGVRGVRRPEAGGRGRAHCCIHYFAELLGMVLLFRILKRIIVSKREGIGMKKLTTLLIVFCLGLALSACGSNSNGDAPSPSGRDFSMGITSDELADDRFVFERQYPFISLSDQYETEGHYTGCLFRVQGEGIKSVTASTSKGVLYRLTYEEFSPAENSERFNAAISWKPSARGLGEHYGQYDDVEIQALGESFDENSPDSIIQVRTSKKLGSVARISSEEYDLNETYFGFWTNDPHESPDNADDFDDRSILDLYEGEKLIVSAEFDDGSFCTKVIELHTAYFRMENSASSSGLIADGNITPEIVAERDADREWGDESTYLSLYGVIAETNDGPFPESLDKVNELENIVSDPYKISETVVWDDESGSIEPTHIYPLGTTITYDTNGIEEDVFSLDITLNRVSKEENVPSYVSIDDVTDSDLEYFNVFSEDLRGFTLQEDGTLTDSHSCIIVDFEATNTGGNPFDDLRLGELVALEDQSNGTFNFNRQNWNLCQGVWDEAGQTFTSGLKIAPGETKQGKVMFILSNEYIEASRLMFLFDNYSDGVLL